MWHLLMAHQQESFLPFSSRQSLSCRLSRVAKRSTAKPRGPLPFPSEPHGPLFPSPKLPDPRPSPPKLVVLSFPSSEPRGPLSIYLLQNLVVPSLLWLLRLGLNPSAHLPSQPHFRLLLQSVTPASIPVFFQLYWAARVSLGRCGPMACSQSSPSSRACRPCNQGELLPRHILGGSHSHPPGSKQGHSYLTYL